MAPRSNSNLEASLRAKREAQSEMRGCHPRGGGELGEGIKTLFLFERLLVLGDDVAK